MIDATLLGDAAARAQRYLDALTERPVAADADAIAGLAGFDTPLPAQRRDPRAVIEQLDRLGSPATVATAGPRYFGYVIGGSLPASLAASWLAAAWDQNAGLANTSPVGAALENVAVRWLVELLGLERGTSGAFVSGATMANFTALAAARHALLARVGWDVEANGLFGAPPITVVVGDEVHVSVLKALSLLGLGRERVVRVPSDAQGRMRAELLPPLDAMTLVCAQAGNVNTGASDPLGTICDAAHAAQAWVHVDGAFGLWAAASPTHAPLVAGARDADSWAVDAHKWLNVPYDSGLTFCRDGAALRAAMSATAAYLVVDSAREPSQVTPELSRRARGVEIWAAIASLGRAGVAEMIAGNCRQAARIAERLRAAGAEILNDVVLNQVLVRFGDDARTRAVIAAVQADGTCWCGGTVWHGMAAMRVSVSNWATTDADAEHSAAAIIRSMAVVATA
jgi:glutamate/tyrosine decarboxylase-like PLP-dependent enzyme